MKLELSDSERRQYEDEGFFVRESIFDNADLERFRAAAERVVGTATRASLEVVESAGASPEQPTESETDYQIDGNRYVEAARATVQFEHRSGSETIRVIEPFHHLDSVFDELVEDPRIVTPICGVLGFDRVALWTDKINLKRPRRFGLPLASGFALLGPRLRTLRPAAERDDHARRR